MVDKMSPVIHALCALGVAIPLMLMILEDPKPGHEVSFYVGESVIAIGSAALWLRTAIAEDRKKAKRGGIS